MKFIVGGLVLVSAGVFEIVMVPKDIAFGIGAIALGTISNIIGGRLLGIEKMRHRFKSPL